MSPRKNFEAVSGSFGPVSGGHPPADQLARFHWHPEQLSELARSQIAQHLTVCPSCTEELATAATFDFSLLQSTEERSAEHRETPPASIPLVVSVPQPPAESRSVALRSRIGEMLDWLRWVGCHPAFTYSVIGLLCIPTFRYYSSRASAVELTRSPVIATPEVGPQLGSVPVPHVPVATLAAETDPAIVSQSLLQQYEAAYGARDIDSLAQVWTFPAETRDLLTQLFSQSRSLRLLVAIEDVRVNPVEKDFNVTFRQALVRLTTTGDVYADDKGIYVARMQWQADHKRWVITQMQEQAG